MTTLRDEQPHHCQYKVINSCMVTVCDTQCEKCKAEGIKMKPKEVKPDFYHWLMMNMPHWIMYRHVFIDTKYKIWIPRWGWSKKQIADAKRNVDEKYSNIKWD